MPASPRSIRPGICRAAGGRRHQGTGGDVGGQRSNFGAQIASGLIESPAVASRLDLRRTTLVQAKRRMDVGTGYAAVVIGPAFTDGLLGLAGGAASDVETGVEPVTHPRAGTLVLRWPWRCRFDSRTWRASGIGFALWVTTGPLVTTWWTATGSSECHPTSRSTSIVPSPTFAATRQHSPTDP